MKSTVTLATLIISLVSASAQHFTATFLSASSETYPAGTTFIWGQATNTAATADPAGPFLAEPCIFKGYQQGGSQEQLGGLYLVYRMRLDFDGPFSLNSITEIGSGATNNGSFLRVMDTNMVVLSSNQLATPVNISATNQIALNLQAASFIIDEFDNSTTWRYRQQLIVSSTPASEYEPFPVVSLNELNEAVKLSFSNLTVGLSYQLEGSTNLNTWTNLGVPFQATNTGMAYPTNFDVNDSGQLFFRLQQTLDCVVSGTQPDYSSFVAGLEVLAAVYGLEYTLQSTGPSTAVSRVMTLDPNGCVIAYCNANPQYCTLTTTTATCDPDGYLVLPAGLSVVTWGNQLSCADRSGPFPWE